MRKLFFSCVFSACGFACFAQEALMGLYSNPVIKQYRATHSAPAPQLSKTAAAFDSLPFFEDFTKTNVFPDPDKWLDSNVFINNSFPIFPPSFNVATFDGLDKYGNAYKLTDGQNYGPSDTLTCKPLDLSVYTTANNIYMSFFYQAAGRGDPPEKTNSVTLAPGDSFLLQFKTVSGAWRTVWATDGIALSDFKQVLIPLNSSIYFYGDFQFRFINYSSHTGNLDQWHLDYIKIDKGRNTNDFLNIDVAISSTPTPLLKNYYSMPWKQFKANAANEYANTFSYYLQNLNNIPVQVTCKHFAFNKDHGNLITNQTFTLGSLALGNPKSVSFSKFNFDSITPVNPDSFTIRNILTAKENSDTRIVNDTFYKDQNFYNYLAYDDGTAESGYGINSGAGIIAQKYVVNTPDTLRAIDIYFNQAETNVTGNLFTLTIWTQLTPVGQSTPNTDKILYRQGVFVPTYQTINKWSVFGGFYRVFLDTPRIVNGTIYIGWRQNDTYVLNIGFDQNYKDNFGQNTPGIFVNTKGFWLTTAFEGALMIRPVLSFAPLPVGMKEQTVKRENILNLFPNPAQNELNIQLNSLHDLTVVIMDMKGAVIQSVQFNGGKLDISRLANGMYNAIVFDGEKYYTKKFMVSR